jgi:hypothetical protein
MTRVFFTVDVEIWLGGWIDLDARFADAFKTYVYGPTRKGNGGLPLKLKILNEHGLKGVFFVEPLFAKRFGMGALEEVVGLIQECGQEVQMHLHTEWADEAPEQLIPGQEGKREFLFMYSQDEQQRLLAIGKELLLNAGVEKVSAFRAGNFGINDDTFDALAKNDIYIDSSYNHVQFGSGLCLSNGQVLVHPRMAGRVLEFPLTIYNDRADHLRHLQLGSCSFKELESVLNHAHEHQWDSVVILSHNFELMNQQRNRIDPVVTKRFEKLTRFLEREKDRFTTAGFHTTDTTPKITDSTLPIAPPGAVLQRYAEQLIRRVYR